MPSQNARNIQSILHHTITQSTRALYTPEAAAIRLVVQVALSPFLLEQLLKKPIWHQTSRLTSQYVYERCSKKSVPAIDGHYKCHGYCVGGAENDGHENDGPSKCPGMKLTNMKMQDMFQVSEWAYLE